MRAPSPFPTAKVVRLPSRLTSPLPKPAPGARSDCALGIGVQVRALRTATRTSAGALAARAGVSRSMLSRVERGLTSPSVDTLERLAGGLGVSISQFFGTRTERLDFLHVPAGRGIPVDRLAATSGGFYELLGHLVSGNLSVTPSLVDFDACGPLPATPAQEGLKFIYVLAGTGRYRYGTREVVVSSGDALLFDASAPHGVETVEEAPMRYLCAVFHLRT